MKDIKAAFDSLNIDSYLLYEAVVSSTDDYIYIIDMSKDVALISENMLRDFELPGRLIHGLVPLWGDLIHKRDQAAYISSIDSLLGGETSEHVAEYQIRNRKNEYIWVICRGLLKRDNNGNPRIFSGIVTHLGDKGRVDHLTGLFTQFECEKVIQQLLEKKQDQGGILLLGLDDFSRINALNNHIMGNSVLRQTAQALQYLLTGDASLYRYDGDEFAIVWEGAAKEEIYELYQKIHAYCNHSYEIDGVPYYCTISGGITMIGTDGDNYLDLIKYASSALESSKRRGKNTCTFFSPDLILAKLHTLALTDQLQRCVSDDMDRFSLAYQPLIDSATLKICGAEALLRWCSKEGGNVSPVEFIPILEADGLIIQVGKWVLEQAVASCKHWISYLPDFVMNINVSYHQMLDKTFPDFVSSVLKKYGLQPQHIVLEMTESYFVTDMEAMANVFRLLRELGIKIAMDDFGTGYSSLGMLSQSPADIVKIDRIFITAINKDNFNRSFISSVIQLCHSVGIQVCVEGVEQLAELETVCQIKADHIQGFYFSKPVPAGDFEEGLKQQLLC